MNRELLARQLLLERARLPVARALERVGGIQMQYAPSGYVGLWSRLDGFRRDDLTRALERRSAVQGTLMRVTIHLVSARDYPLLAAAVRDGRRESWIRARRDRADVPRVEAAAARTRELLADGPRPRDELLAELGADATTWNGVGVRLDLVRVPPSGTWERRRADRFALAGDWLGAEPAAADDGLDLLVRRYLAGFGPARPADLADWAGLPPAAVAPALDRLRVRRFRDEEGKELVDLPRAPLPDPETPAPVRFLPTWDATLLVHARRTGILPEAYRPPRLLDPHAAVRAHVPRRRRRRRHVAARARPRRRGAVRAAPARGEPRGRGRGRAAHSLPCVTRERRAGRGARGPRPARALLGSVPARYCTTPQATRAPASPVPSVAASGPGVLLSVDW